MFHVEFQSDFWAQRQRPGTFIGWWLDLEQGPTIVLLLGIAFAIGFLISPRYGLFKR